MTSFAGGPVYRWLAVGPEMLAVAAAVVYVTKETQPWLSAVTLALAMFALVISLVMAGGKPIQPRMVRNLPGDAPAPRWLLLLALMAIVITAATADNFATQTATYDAVAHRWLISIGLLLLIGWWHPLAETVRAIRARRWPAITMPSHRIWGPWLGMIAVAAIPRLVLLNRYPTVIIGDEGQYMIIARAFREGTLPNPFGPGFSSNPNLYPAMGGWVAGLVGPDTAGYRTFSALVGVIGVLAAWRLGRYLIGPRPAAIGAIILAVMPFHLHFSRMALNNVTDPTALALALLFLLRSLRYGHRRDAVACGLALGFGFYGYFGGRVFPVIMLVVVATLVLGRRAKIGLALRSSAWMVASFLASAMPLIVAFWNLPSEFSSRASTVSPFTVDRLFNDPGGVVPLYLEHLHDALLFPLVSNVLIFYRHEAPFLGWLVAVLTSIGIATWISLLIRSRDVSVIAMFIVPWIMLAAGVALTMPVQSQRLMAVTPFISLAAGSGLFAMARWLANAWRAKASLVSRAVVIAVLLTMAANDLRWLATEERQTDTYWDHRAVIAWDMGWRASQQNIGSETLPPVLFAGPPMMFSNGWGSLAFLAPELAISDVNDPLAEISSAPALPEDTVLVLISERDNERCVAEQIYPDATVAEVHGSDGSLLYAMFFHEPLTGWSRATTPTETTFDIVTESACGAEASNDTANGRYLVG